MNKEIFSANEKRGNVELPEISRQQFLGMKGEEYGKLVIFMQNRVLKYRSGNDAEDIVQDTLIRTHKILSTKKGDKDFPRSDSLTRYALKILNNIAIDYYRKSKSREKRDGKPSSLESEIEVVPGKENTEDNVVRSDQYVLILDELKTVIKDDRLRRAWIMYEVHGMTYEEIARAQQVPLGTVRSGINRARAKLNNSLSQFDDLR